jgi:hypothetical protein
MASRHETIEGLKADAERLMSIATQEPLKEQVRLALRDVDQSLLWLSQPNVNEALLKTVDLTLQLAGWRLTMVEDALKSRGPDATLIGG